MRKSLFLGAATLSLSAVEAGAQVPLGTYTDANGYLDIQKLTCGTHEAEVFARKPRHH